MKALHTNRYFQLHLLFFFYSIINILYKTAAGYELLSKGFLIFFGLVIGLITVYAYFWQKIIKRFPLVVAYSNKGIDIVWAMMWGVLLFGENISPQNVCGAALTILGIILVAKDG